MMPMIPTFSLLASLIILIAGPLAYYKFRPLLEKAQWFEKTITLLVLLFILLELLEHEDHISWGPFILLFLGAFFIAKWGEGFLFHITKTNGSKPSNLKISYYMIPASGLIAHTFMDGVVLRESVFFLPMAVILHRIPTSFLIWSLFYKKFGKVIPACILCFMALGTLTGFFLSKEVLPDHHYFQYLQAIVAGTLLHVTYHNSHSIRQI